MSDRRSLAVPGVPRKLSRASSGCQHRAELDLASWSRTRERLCRTVPARLSRPVPSGVRRDVEKVTHLAAAESNRLVSALRPAFLRGFAAWPQPQHDAVATLIRLDNRLGCGRLTVAEDEDVETPGIELTQDRYRIVAD